MNDAIQKPEHQADVLIIGAGIAGLIAARELQNAGLRVLVLDKGRGVGGRLANRRIGLATFDHGAQFITTRDPVFGAVLEQVRRAGLIKEWCFGFSGNSDGHVRWRGEPTMTSVAKYLAQGINLRLETKVGEVRRVDDRFIVETNIGELFAAQSIVMTPPVPQSLAILDAGEIPLSSEMRTRLEGVQYERCMAVMAVLDGPSKIPPPGGFQPPGGPIDWIADNQLKGVSIEPAVTLHASHAFSVENWDHDRQVSGQFLIDAASQWLGANVKSFQMHGWRYSKPMRIDAEFCALLNESPTLILAGDAFGGPRVEGAALSGIAAARAILKRPFDGFSHSSQPLNPPG